jgi:hypothetical protein
LSTTPNESPTTKSPVRSPIRHFIAAVKAVFSLPKKRAPSGFVLRQPLSPAEVLSTVPFSQ